MPVDVESAGYQGSLLQATCNVTALVVGRVRVALLSNVGSADRNGVRRLVCNRHQGTVVLNKTEIRVISKTKIASNLLNRDAFKTMVPRHLVDSVAEQFVSTAADAVGYYLYTEGVV